jgi:predicted ATP-dependent endonuclease of OLD family
MRIKSLYINNWNVIREANFENLGDFVVVAGPNGVGKTQIKDVICYIFQNNGNPPPNCRVTLQATNQTEMDIWKKEEFSLPFQPFWGFFSQANKKIKTKSRLIQIDANRAIDTIEFRQLTFDQIGDPENENTNYSYGISSIKDRFTDICATLQRMKSREITKVYQEYNKHFATDSSTVTFNKVEDPIAKYQELFNNLLYPKKMCPIEIQSTTIQYIDTDGSKRNFLSLSSGEKEIVIVIFDLYTQNPSNCIILIDEPELHLHPELTFRFLNTLSIVGERNQFFLFTHSVDIIGSSLENGVYFLRQKDIIATGNQVVKIDKENLPRIEAIPNLRETIGMISVGKKVVFVEGNAGSIDRNVFGLIAKSKKIDMAIIPSLGCANITNMGLLVDSIESGILGIEFHMIRDRDSLTNEMIAAYITKSKGRLHFLPFYHIENSFLNVDAIYAVARTVLFDRTPSKDAIEQRIIQLAMSQKNYLIGLYLKNEIYFAAGNFDVSPDISLNDGLVIDSLAENISKKALMHINRYSELFTEKNILERAIFWDNELSDALKDGWSRRAQEIVYGKRLLKEMQIWLFSSKSISLWELIAKSDLPECKNALLELQGIIDDI